MHHPRSNSVAALIGLAAISGAAAALVAVLLAGRLPDPVIIVFVIVAASIFGWRRTPMTPARIRARHQFTVVSRCGDGFVTVDSLGARRVARRVVLGGPPS